MSKAAYKYLYTYKTIVKVFIEPKMLGINSAYPLNKRSYSSIRRFLAQYKTDHPEGITSWTLIPAMPLRSILAKDPPLWMSMPGKSSPPGSLSLPWPIAVTSTLEIVIDQKVETWLGCHRMAFEFFEGVPQRLIIDNAKCATVKSCFHDPAVHELRLYLQTY